MQLLASQELYSKKEFDALMHTAFLWVVLLLFLVAPVFPPLVPAHAESGRQFSHPHATPMGVGVNGLLGSSSSPRNQFTGSTATGTTTCASSACFSWVGASSEFSGPANTGIKGMIHVMSYQVSGCLSFWVDDYMDPPIGKDILWGQVGYYICDSSAPIAFYEIWDITTATGLGGGQLAATPLTIGMHTFSMTSISGTTEWLYTVDGIPIPCTGTFGCIAPGTFDMGANVSSSVYSVSAYSEIGYNQPFDFPAVEFPTAMLVLESGTWSPVTLAQSQGTAWGVAGHYQNAALANGQMIVGGSVLPLALGTILWNGNYSATYPLDNTAPTVSFLSPASGSSVSGNVAVSLSATDNIAVSSVSLYVDGVFYASTSSAPYSFIWNTTKSPNGTHTLSASAIDTSGNPSTSNSVQVVVANAVVSVLITSPRQGATVSGSVTISASAIASLGVQRVEFYIDGVLLCGTSSSPYSCTWNTRHFSNGPHAISAIAYDMAGNSGQVSVTVNVGPISKGPKHITAPPLSP